MSDPSPSLRRALAAIAIAGALACAILLALAIDSVGGHHRDLIAIFGPLIGGAFIGTGLLAWMRRPENRFGALMVALGFAYCLSGLIVTTQPWPFIAGLALIAVPYALLFHILLAFPTGRIESRGARALAAAAYFVATAGWWLCMVFEDTTRLGVPANPLLISDQPDLFKVLANTRLAIVAALIAALFVVLARRRRRGSMWVYLSGGLVLALYAVWAVLGVLGASTSLQDGLERARVVALALVPFAFLAGLLRSKVAGAAAVSELVVRLGGSRHGSLRDELAEALGDPSLELAYWTPTGWVDASGAPFIVAEGRASTPVENVALLVHDASVADERELVSAVVGAAALALENERLAAELRASVKELRASRARIVKTADAARRAIERDLHDGAQQQLVALALSLRLARTRVERDPAEAGRMLDAATRELQAALQSLRELARGIHPAVLSDHGLGAALEALAARFPFPVEVVSVPEERLPDAVEATAYFVVAEAITNVARYAHANGARVSVEHCGDELTVAVSDDGIGGADPGGGSGLRGLADRVAVLDGSLSVDSPPGRGTTVRAAIPCPPPARGVAPGRGAPRSSSMS
ncbi:sensor histidine kinase [Candidatus Solirubrobacter pratensis]|uniref:sensor histidine kinase n=1 Tax=Candidatus Solirubrobacter pratensis TaxID=1298857 RepID=UPI000415273F|nr:histidine kinase [Candidatus Solirubrobacter pratensis]